MAIDPQRFPRTLFRTADQLWMNMALRQDQYARSALALIGLKQMEAKFEAVEAELGPRYIGRLKPAPADYRAPGAEAVKNWLVRIEVKRNSSHQRANANQ
jgi:type I restriction enzyme M protein